MRLTDLLQAAHLSPRHQGPARRAPLIFMLGTAALIGDVGLHAVIRIGILALRKLSGDKSHRSWLLFGSLLHCEYQEQRTPQKSLQPRLHSKASVCDMIFCWPNEPSSSLCLPAIELTKERVSKRKGKDGYGWMDKSQTVEKDCSHRKARAMLKTMAHPVLRQKHLAWHHDSTFESHERLRESVKGHQDAHR